MMETQAVDSPSPLAEFLDVIKEKYEGFANPTMYKIVKIPARYDGSSSVVWDWDWDTEIVYTYEDLCVKMFDLDVSGWEISSEIAAVPNEYIGDIFNVVTIRMTRAI